jgi:hypothetical protein
MSPSSEDRAKARRRASARGPQDRSPVAALRALWRWRDRFGPEAAARKLELLRRLERARLPHAAQVLRLHEILCFLAAHPDDARLRRRVERMLGAFAARPDLGRHARSLEDSGIAGTALTFRFFAETARWLARRWPRLLRVDWDDYDHAGRLEPWLALIAHPAESPALDELALDVREWVARMKSPRETDATFLVNALVGRVRDPALHETLYDQLDPPLRLLPGRDTPSRTRDRVASAPIRFQSGPLRRGRPDLRAEILRPPLAVRAASPREGRRLVDLARAAMVSRNRDLDVFAYGDPRDVTVVDCGEGLQFASIGAIPECRLLLEAVYGYLTLKNGVPIGYVLTSALFGSCEVAYNVFETWRGTEAAWVYGRALATARHLFGADTFVIYPFQLGEGNEEALGSGAWWFYQKLGFRPRAREARRRMRLELRRMASNPKHRSSRATLARLAASHLFYHLGPERADVIGRVALENVGLAAMRRLARDFGADRPHARHACALEAAARIGLRSWTSWPAPERAAWERWAPVVLELRGIARWNTAERRALVQVIRAKGGRRESEFVRRFDRHDKLRRAIQALAAS